MHRSERQKSTKPEAAGLVIHQAVRYDLLVWIFTLGREKRLRERMLRLAQLQPEEDVLDIGCGTGSLAILAKRVVGARGTVHGIDASPEMIARARAKARRAGVDVCFAEGAVQALPLPDMEVDVVLSTLMLHHVPRQALPQIAHEIKRVLKPSGRLLVVDFTKPAAEDRSLMDRFHRHGFIRLDDIIQELEIAGFGILRSGPVGQKNLHFVFAAAGSAIESRADGAEGNHPAAEHSASGPARRHGRLLLTTAAVTGALAMMALHVAAALSAGQLASDLASSPLSYVAAILLALVVVVKIGLLGWAHRFGAGIFRGWLGAREERIQDK
jgi:ubiquinone/menaquinone biosynthesis C-methylase UbiE